jgi:hypothetical protein
MSERDSSSLSLNQFKSHLVFQALNRLRDSGLTETKFLRRSRDMLKLSNF